MAGVYTPGRNLHQDSPGIPGSNERGDRFGAAVTIVKNLYDQTSVAIGTPADRVGTVERAGSVTLVPINVDAALPAKRFSQFSPAVPDDADFDDGFGAALSYLPGSTDGLIVGIPFEGNDADWQGVVSYTRDLATWDALTFDQPRAGTAFDFPSFGKTFAQPATAR